MESLGGLGDSEAVDQTHLPAPPSDPTLPILERSCGARAVGLAVGWGGGSQAAVILLGLGVGGLGQPSPAVPAPGSWLAGRQPSPAAPLPLPPAARAGSSNVPHKTSLPEGIRVGTVMRIRGVVPNKAGRFYVNLLCGEAPGSEAALHFNPRLDESTVVFNTLEQGAWGREERGTGIPFQRGQPFDVLLIATDEGFKAVVGDSEYHHFRYRIPPARVRLLEVGGDLQLESVSVF
ncbi:galectin-7-like [Canis lupus familiaris]|uniref:galectin-7-like n=1 Tax=Canis lupus familiaris TaxID=9615 RepID=UPI0018F65C86|nr:galectin-7-like [Canis lupus familiaris]